MKNLIFWVGVSDPSKAEKHGNFEYLQYSRLAWQKYCKKHSIELYCYDTRQGNQCHNINWQRWLDLYELLSTDFSDYDNVCLIDGSTIVNWKAAEDIFNLDGVKKSLESGKLIANKSLENIKWVLESCKGYEEFGDIDPHKYFSSGFVMGNIAIMQKLTQWTYGFYMDNRNDIIEVEKAGRGTDQPAINLLSQLLHIDLNAIPPDYWIMHPFRFEWHGHNWQKKSSIPHLYKYAKIVAFSGFDRRKRKEVMEKFYAQILNS